MSILLLAGVVALGACGRRGPLEPPPGSVVPPPRADLKGVTDPASQSNPTRPSLNRDTTGSDTFNREQILSPAAPVTTPSTPFVLDPLL